MSKQKSKLKIIPLVRVQLSTLTGKTPPLRSVVLGLLGVLVLAEISILGLSFKGRIGPSSIGKEVKVVLSESGFSPDKITIEQGDTVVFSTSRSQYFWPASNPHPVHTIYPEFDPKRPIGPKETWSFRFDKKGDWSYHDHIAPYFTGQITVGEKTSNSGIAQIKNCPPENKSLKEKCWDEVMDWTIQNKGLPQAFGVFSYLYANDKDFVADSCHWHAHKIGWAAYQAYKLGEKVNLTTQTTYCGYGFFHGFMEKLLRDTKDVAQAQQFCDEVGRELNSTAPLSRLNCYHGIGHGMVGDTPDPSIYGNARAMINPSLDQCDKVSTNPNEIEECSNGVYNAVVLLMESKQAGLSFNDADPFQICREERPSHQKSCYYETSQKLDRLSHWDPLQVNQFLTGLDDNISRMVMSVATAAMMQRDIVRTDNSSYITVCRQVQENLRDSCLGGVVGGFMAHGEPEKQYVKAFDFCNLDLMTDHEHNLCYTGAISSIRSIYAPTKVAEICQLVAKPYQHYCPSTS